MDTQILKQDAPFDYIFCNGEIGKHIATLIVYDTTIDEAGFYELESHSHPIVKYWNAPGGVVWNRAELTDCEVLCNDDDKRVDIEQFGDLAFAYYHAAWEDEEMDKDQLPSSRLSVLVDMKEKLTNFGISFKTPYDQKEKEIFIHISKEGDVYETLCLSHFCHFSFESDTLKDVKYRLWDEREYWEDFYDHVVSFTFNEAYDPEYDEFAKNI